jgi:Fe-S-cluster containining protein
MNDAAEQVYRILSRYQELLHGIDIRAEDIRAAYPGQIRCGRGCSDCCHQPFDISWLEGFYLWVGCCDLEEGVRDRVLERARAYADWAQTQGWGRTETLDGSREERADRMRLRISEMSRAHRPCPLLEEEACLLYDFRPAVCRLAGYPLPDPVEEGVLYACYLNFTGQDLAGAPVESFDVDRLYAAEANLEGTLIHRITGREFSVRHTTQIAEALRTAYDRTDWAAFFQALERRGPASPDPGRRPPG